MDFESALEQYEQEKAAREADRQEREEQRTKQRQEEFQFIVDEFGRMEIFPYLVEQERQMKAKGFWAKVDQHVMDDRITFYIKFVPVRGDAPKNATYGGGYENVAELMFQGFRDAVSVAHSGVGAPQIGNGRWPWGFDLERVESKFAEFVKAALEKANKEG